METIRKKICKETFTSRLNGKVPCIKYNKDSKYNSIGEDVDYIESNENKYSDYGNIPYNFILISGTTGEEFNEDDLRELSKKLYSLKDNIGYKENFIRYSYKIRSYIYKLYDDSNWYEKYNIDDIVGDIESSSITTHTRYVTNINEIPDDYAYTANTTTQYILSFNDMIKYYKLLKDIIFTCKYYKLCNIDGKADFVELTDEMWEDIFSNYESGTCEVYDSICERFNEDTYDESYESMINAFKKFFIYNKMFFLKNLPYPYYYKIKDFSGNTVYYQEESMIPNYYTYVSKTDEKDENGNKYDTYFYSGNTVYLTEEEYEYLDDSNYPSYIEGYNSDGEIEYKTTFEELGDDFIKWKEITYDISAKTYDYEYFTNDFYGIDDLIFCVNDDMDNIIKFFKQFKSREVYSFKEESSGLTLNDYYNNEFFDVSDIEYEILPSEERDFYEYYFLKTVWTLKDRMKNSYEREETDVIPHANIRFYIEQQFDDIGKYTPNVREWDTSKRYYPHDIVLYKGKYFRLKSFNTEKQYENYGFKFETYTIAKNESLKNYVDFFGGDLWNTSNGMFTIPYYTGYYDPVTHMTLFDQNINNDSLNNLMCWDYVYLEDEDSIEETEISAITPSQLEIFKRKFSNMIDGEGNSVPFSFTISGETVLSDTELPYKVGIADKYTYKDVNYYNVLTDVSLYYNSGATLLSSFSYDPDVLSGDFDSIIKTSDVDYEDEAIDTIEFIYYTDCTLNENGSINDGIKHVERYNCTLDTLTCKIEDGLTYSGDGLNAEWVEYNINHNTTDDDDYDEDEYEMVMDIPDALENVGKVIKVLSDDNDGYTKNSYYISEPIFRYFNIGESLIGVDNNNNPLCETTMKASRIEEKIANFDCQQIKEYQMIGVFDVNEEISVNIARGTSSALEKHHILSEVNTFEDLENYRNNLFNL